MKDEWLHLKQLERAERYYKDDKEDLLIRENRDKLLQCVNEMEEEPALYEEGKALYGMFDFSCTYFCPLRRLTLVICKRINEDEVMHGSAWLSAPVMQMFTIKELFAKLANEVAPHTAEYIIGTTECSFAVKSDLLESIRAHNLDLFEQTVRSHDVNLQKAQQACAYICNVTDYATTLRNNIVADCIENVNVNCSDEDILKKIGAAYSVQAETIKDICKQQGAQDDDIKSVGEYMAGINSKFKQFFQTTNPIVAMFYETFIQTINLVCSLQALFEAGQLNGIETEFIKDFQKRKLKDNKFAATLFSRIFAGNFLEHDFNVNSSIKDTYKELLDRCTASVGRQLSKLPAIAQLPQPAKENKDMLYKYKDRLPLNTDYSLARHIFDKAIRKGLMIRDGEAFKWNGKMSLLAYFCGRLFFGDYVEDKYSHMKPVWKKEKNWIKLYDKTLDVLFPNQKIDAARIYRNKQVRCSAGGPQGHDTIDALFE